MAIIEELEFSDDLDFLLALPEEGEAAPEHDPEATVEEDDSDDELDVNELERRVWKYRMRLKRLKEQNKETEAADNARQCQPQEQARRKRMSRAQDGILKYMLKMMEVCKAKGFVYGIIPENGKPVTGASDSLREWWKEKRLYPDGCTPPSSSGSGSNFAISGTSDYDVEVVDDEDNYEEEDCQPLFNHLNIGTSGQRDGLMHHFMAELTEGDSDSGQKRKQLPEEPQMMLNHQGYTCEYLDCPYHDYHLGFRNITARNNHQLTCSYRNNSSQIGMSSVHPNSDKLVGSLSSPQPNPAIQQPVNQTMHCTFWRRKKKKEEKREKKIWADSEEEEEEEEEGRRRKKKKKKLPQIRRKKEKEGEGRWGRRGRKKEEGRRRRRKEKKQKRLQLEEEEEEEEEEERRKKKKKITESGQIRRKKKKKRKRKEE
ncbi:hypothetical protein C1H46_030329 [Malus baccata]|uniref:Ethylene insensitive 3-like DNA-binding domain-containing protein n=1 Tax=Malus baccata TaxID=106549 RepID=A0A540LCP8_MALBA|nr:hypothetical protein C1H46_030329 [Malus baccata]